MRGFPDSGELASCTRRVSQRFSAAWMIPLMFFAATIVSLAAGMALPALLETANPGVERVGMHAAAELTPTGDDDYVQGLTKLRRAGHSRRSGPSDSEIMYCSVLDGIAHPM
jgi:hypothetical protein